MNVKEKRKEKTQPIPLIDSNNTFYKLENEHIEQPLSI